MKPIRFDRIPTEQRNSRSTHLDRLSAAQIVALMTEDGRQVLSALRRAKQPMARAAERMAVAMSRGGRLVIVGAGTSGRLGVLEAAECPPTFNTGPGVVTGIMAGGRSAVFRSKEGVEDSVQEGTKAVRRVKAEDVVIGVAASGVTPYVHAALKEARRRRASTVLLTCNPQAARPGVADIVIALSTGAEILSGSTRLKAGTACKMALNMLTTASMVRLGKVYENWMVDLQPKSRKLVARGVRLIEQLGRVSKPRAERLFKEAGGRVKVAIVMARLNVNRSEALSRLARADGFLRKVIG